MPSLALLIGGTTALTVAVVAAVTLSITLAFSLDAVNSLASDATASLLGLAGEKLDAHIARPRDAVLAVSTYFGGGEKPWPSDDPTWATADALMEMCLGAWRTARSVATVAVILADGSYFQTQLNPRDRSHVLQVYNVLRDGGAIEHKLRSFFIANGSDSPPALLSGVAVPQEFTALFQPRAYFTRLLSNVFVGDDAENAYLPPPIALQFGNAPPFLQLSMHAAPVNASGTRLGVLASGIPAMALSDFLQASKVTAGTELFVVGPDRRVLATTHAAPFYTVHTNVSRTAAAPDGCSTTLTTTSAPPGTPVFWICRQALADSAFAPAAALSGTDADWRLPPPGVQRVLLAGSRYFVGVRRQALERVFGYTLAQVILIPEDDVAGFVREGVAVAVGVTCAVLVVAVALSSLVVVLLLRPLKGVAARMERAAALQADDEDGAAGSVSVIAEVRELQESFDALSAELQRLKSFVPDAVLAHHRALSGDEDGSHSQSDSVSTASRFATSGRSEVVAKIPTVPGVPGAANEGGHGGMITRTPLPHQPSDRSRSNSDTDGTRNDKTKTQRSQSQYLNRRRSGTRGSTSSGARSSHSSLGGAPILNTLAGLSERNVTVLVLNCAGFNAATRAMPHRAMGELYAQFVAAVVRAVHDHGGVLDAFHGDRVLASFNGARAAAAHARRGVAAAHAIAARAVPATLGLAAHVGVGSGRCRVGNAGCDGARRFSVFGTAVARASALCARAAAYTEHGRAAVYVPSRPLAAAREPVPLGSAVLVSGALFDEAEPLFATAAIDAGAICRSDRAATVTAAVLGVLEDPTRQESAAPDANWMYVVNGTNVNSRDPQTIALAAAEAASNAVSDRVTHERSFAAAFRVAAFLPEAIDDLERIIACLQRRHADGDTVDLRTLKRVEIFAAELRRVRRAHPANASLPSAPAEPTLLDVSRRAASTESAVSLPGAADGPGIVELSPV